MRVASASRLAWSTCPPNTTTFPTYASGFSRSWKNIPWGWSDKVAGSRNVFSKARNLPWEAVRWETGLSESPKGSCNTSMRVASASRLAWSTCPPNTTTFPTCASGFSRSWANDTLLSICGASASGTGLGPVAQPELRAHHKSNMPNRTKFMAGLYHIDNNLEIIFTSSAGSSNYVTTHPSRHKSAQKEPSV